MPGITREQIDEFIGDLEAASGRPPAAPPTAPATPTWRDRAARTAGRAGMIAPPTRPYRYHAANDRLSAAVGVDAAVRMSDAIDGGRR